MPTAMQNAAPVIAMIAASACSPDSGAGPDVAEDAEALDVLGDPDVAADVASPDAADVESPDTPDDVALDPSPGDAATDAADAVDAPDAPPPRFERVVTTAADFAAPEGYRWARGIVHLHSAHSHDACDGEPRIDGEVNAPCRQSLRDALCATRIDVAWLTDHPTHMIEVPFAELLLFDEGTDTLVLDDDGLPVANRMSCPDGHVVTLRAGAEDDVMPVGLHRHVSDDPDVRSELMRNAGPESIGAMRDAGALVWTAHTEEKSLAWLQERGLDGVEIYQLHANIDPDIRRDSLGLDPFAPFADLVGFLVGSAESHPDLALLAFLSDNQPSLDRWAALLAEGPVTGTAGTDAHENVFQQVASDGERLDSYRCMLSWFSNYLLVTDDSWQAAQAALAAGRIVIGFDLFAPIDGFDARVLADGARHEVGATLTWAPGAELRVDVPRFSGPGGAAQITTRLLRAEGESWVEVATTPDASLVYPIEAPGIFRVEVRVTAEHLRPVLYELERFASADYPWIMTNAFRVVSADGG